MFWIAEWRRLGIGRASGLAGVGVMQNVQPFCISSHQTVLYTVVHHLHKMAGAAWTTVQIAFFGCTADSFAAWRARNLAATRRQRLENWIEMFDDRCFAANHLRVTALR